MKRAAIFIALPALLAGCTPLVRNHLPAPSASAPNLPIAPFSAHAGNSLPNEWKPFIILRTKKPTEYRIVPDNGKKVVHAYAREASSGLMHHTNIDPHAQPWLHWRWKVGRAVETADHQLSIEDSPARIILGFDGDKDELPFSEQILFETAKMLTGQELPYATLMYVWDKHAPIGTVKSSRRSSRVKMMVVANEASGVGHWQSFARNIVDDYMAAFGEKPAQLIGVGILTDTDNLGGAVEAWYGDIHLQPGHQ